MKVSDHFDIRELVHPDIYERIGARCLGFIHPSAVPTLEMIRRGIADSITINNWHTGGALKDSGLRLPLVVPTQSKLINVIQANLHKGDAALYEAIVGLFKGTGARMSSHRFGCGFDLKFGDTPAPVAHAYILKHQYLFPNIIRMEAIEATPTWVHVEFGAYRDTGVEIVVFKP